MARTILQIQAEIMAAKAASAELAVYDSPGKTALFLLWAYVTAVVAWSVEKLFDLHILEAKRLLAADKSHRTAWYAGMVKKFQIGMSLVTDQDYYDNTGLTDQQIADAKIVRYASVTELPNELLIKVAREISGDLAPLTAPQLTALEAYMAEVKDGGVFLTFVNDPADSLKLDVRINYDALILDATGKRLDGTNDTPVADAIDDYLKNGIAFNGDFVILELVERLKQVEGVIIPTVLSASARYGVLPFQSFAEFHQPKAGYLRIAPVDLTLTYIPR